MRRWPLVAAGIVLVVSASSSVIVGDLEVVGGAWVVLWGSVLIVGTVIVARVPGSAIGTIMFVYGMAAFGSVLLLGMAAEFSPNSVPWYESVAWAVNTAALMLASVLLLRFPTGSLLSPRWRAFEVIAAFVAAAGALAAFIANGWGGDPGQARIVGPLYDDHKALADAAAAVSKLGVVVLVGGLVSLVVRYRRGDHVQRVQLRWLLFAVALVIVTLPALDPVASNTYQASDPWTWVMAAVLSTIPISIGVAIVRHSLYDIDLLISRSLIYGSVLAVITGVYVAIVFGVGSLIGETTSDSPVLPIIATAVIAMIFQPARERLERVANRVVFGRRATPYEVLSEFTHRVAATDDKLLSGIAKSIADGTVASAASVSSLDDGVLHPVSVWPEDAAAASETYVIEHDGSPIGQLGITLPAGEMLPPADAALIDELTNGIGLALWNRSLTSDLQASVDDLQASRRRMVAIQDETRHGLERDLHDGAEQRLVAIKVRLSIAKRIAEKNGAKDTATALAELCDETDAAVESLRDFARGVYPPLLQAEGLRAALRALPVTLDDRTARRHPKDVEATTYFAILETIAAIGQGSVNVCLTETPGQLEFEVVSRHDFDPPVHLTDRFAALDGNISFAPNTATGTLPTTILLEQPELVSA